MGTENMTPKEKVEEFITKFYPRATSYSSDRKNQNENAKQCALIAVDEIMKVTAPYCDRFEPYYQELDDIQTQVYWQEVKQEIEKL